MTELFGWRTQAGYAVHILNYTNPNMLRGWFRETYPLGPQQVRMELPRIEKVKEVRALKSGAVLRPTFAQGSLSVVVPRIEDYEILALTL